MPPVFAHGRLRLYLLKLLDEAPRHGYEVIRLLEERFQGHYAPSAGTVYPRLAKLEAEGLVTHTTEGGRKVYSLTRAGRDELRDRRRELSQLEREIRTSLAGLTGEDVAATGGEAGARTPAGAAGGGGDGRRAAGARQTTSAGAEDWREQARRAREESRRARWEARQAREQARRARAEVQEELQRLARRVQEEVQSRLRTGDWQEALRAGMAELGRELGAWRRISGQGAERAGWCPTDGADAEAAAPSAATVTSGASDAGPRHAAAWVPAWGEAPAEPVPDPVRELERLLDRCRDDIRDAARDHGVSQEQLREARRRLSETSAHLVAMFRGAGGHRPDRPTPHPSSSTG